MKCLLFWGDDRREEAKGKRIESRDKSQESRNRNDELEDKSQVTGA